MGNNAKCGWCREQAGCHVVSVRVKEPNESEDGAGFIVCEACQQDFSRYVGYVRKVLPALIDDDFREWFLIEGAEDERHSDRRVHVNDLDNGRITGPFDEVRFGMGRDWSYRILFTRRAGATNTPWEILFLRNQGGELNGLVCEDGVGLPEMDGTGMSVFEVLDLSVEATDTPHP